MNRINTTEDLNIFSEACREIESFIEENKSTFKELAMDRLATLCVSHMPTLVQNSRRAFAAESLLATLVPAVRKVLSPEHPLEPSLQEIEAFLKEREKS